VHGHRRTVQFGALPTPATKDREGRSAVNPDNQQRGDEGYLTASHQAERIIQAHPGEEAHCLQLRVQACHSGVQAVAGDALMNHAG